MDTVGDILTIPTTPTTPTIRTTLQTRAIPTGRTIAVFQAQARVRMRPTALRWDPILRRIHKGAIYRQRPTLI